MEASTEEKQDKEQQEERSERSDGDGKDKNNVGTVEEVQGVVLEAVFPDGLPEINHAIVLEIEGGDDDAEGEGDGTRTLVCEVQQHLGDERVRAVAMDSTDGVARGTEVRDTGGPITVPVGDDTLGRIFNLLGAVIDEGVDVETE